MEVEPPDRDVIGLHQRERHHAGLRDPFDVEVSRVNPTCGDRVVLRLRLDGARVADVSYRALGCTVSQASASAMSDAVIGTGVDDALALRERFGRLLRGEAPATGPDDQDDLDALGDAVAFRLLARNAVRMRCALLCWDALAGALAQTRPTAPV